MTVALISEIAKAAHDLNAADPTSRLIAWGHFERAGLAKTYIVGGRFIHFCLNEAGHAALAAAEKQS